VKIKKKKKEKKTTKKSSVSLCAQRYIICKKIKETKARKKNKTATMKNLCIKKKCKKKLQ
jgi:hypothetical protein